MYASLPSLYQRRRHLIPSQGCGVLPHLVPTKTEDSWLIPCLSLNLSLSHSYFTLPLTDVNTARTADSCPGWVSALATVGTVGKMEGVMEGGKHRIIWVPLPKAPLLVSWHQKWWFRWWHRMATQQLASSVAVSPCHLQITKIKCYCDTVRPTHDTESRTINSTWHISYSNKGEHLCR